MTVSAIYGNVYHTIILGLGYSADFKVGSSVLVRPTDNNPSVNYTGIASLVQNAVLTNDGFVYGSNEAAAGGHGSPGGIGVALADAGDQFVNFGGMTGGNGGNSLGANGYGNYGGNGGAAVNLSGTGATSTNFGFILGGVGGSGSLGYGSGSGGTGLNLSGGTLDNSGGITGGAAGSSSQDFHGATGGTGAVVGSGGTLNNSSAVQGGHGGGGYYAGQGGIGVSLAAGAAVVNNGSLSGGIGGAATSNTAAHATGGYGGAGLTIANGAAATVAKGSSVDGGNGGQGDQGGVGGTGILLAAGGTLQISGAVGGGTGGNSTNTNLNNDGFSSGAGGAGANFAAGSTATINAGAVIEGGTGGGIGLGGQVAAGFGIVGSGGVGLEVGTGSALTNSGSILGGTGGIDNTTFNPGIFGAPPVGGTGGVGISLTRDFFVNRGAITGGRGGDAPSGPFGGTGGAGAYFNGGTLDTFGSISGGYGGKGGVHQSPYYTGYQGAAVQFGPNSGNLLIESTATFAGSIDGFVVGDIIDIKDMNPLEVLKHIHPENASFPTRVQIGTYTNGTLSIYTTSADAGDRYSLLSDGGTGTDFTLVAACYLRGTRIATAAGELPIESVKIGDAVLTYSGAMRRVRWIGWRRYSRESVAADRDLSPVRIRAGALAPGVPRRDLCVSPRHCLFLDGMLITARDLVNGSSIVHETWTDDVSYFHLEFDSHDVILAEGAPSESFVDDDSRRLFDNCAEYHRLYGAPTGGPTRFCAPLVEDGEALEAVRRRLWARAVGIDAAADDRLWSGGMAPHLASRHGAPPEGPTAPRPRPAA